MSPEDVSTESNFAELRERVGNLEKGLADNTLMTTHTREDVSTLLAILATAQGGLKVLGMLGTGFKWLVTVAGSLVAIWLAYRSGIK